MEIPVEFYLVLDENNNFIRRAYDFKSSGDYEFETLDLLRGRDLLSLNYANKLKKELESVAQFNTYFTFRIIKIKLTI
jgi:hypothetical protein